MSTSSAKAPAEVHYPDSDGKPMGETGIHVNTTIELFATLKKYIYKDHPSVYVAADMFFYYEQGNPRAVKAPDIMVIKGVSHTEERRSFKLWVENRVPSVIFEITSPKTRRDDAVVKLELYARLGVTEYFLFDPLREYLNPPLQGHRLVDGRYVALEPGPDGGLESVELGFEVRGMGRRIRLIDPATGKIVPSFEEIALQASTADDLSRRLAEEQKEREKQRRRAAREAKKADAERQKADAERQKADAERQKSEALEAEVKRLRALLGERESGLER